MNLSITKNKNINKKDILKIVKHMLLLAIFVIVLKELISIISSFDINIFKKYIKDLSIVNIITIMFLGIISYLPLSFYDFVLKKKADINLDNKQLYKYSWIASSIASIAGFGGSTALVLKGNFYKDYVKDEKLLLKEISKIIALNLTGFSMVCLIYILMNITNLNIHNIKNIGIAIISLYLPILLAYFLYKYKKKNIDVKDSIKIILISILEWITTIVLIYSIIKILKINIGLYEFFPIFVLSIVVAIASMSPGGIGSFDLSLLLGLQAFNVEGEKVLLVIFLYRVSYYLIPLLIGMILYYNEIFTKKESKTFNIINNITSKVSYRLILLISFLFGSLLILQVVMPQNFYNIKILRILLYSSGYDLFNNILIGFLLITMSMFLVYKSKIVYKVALSVIIGLVFISTITSLNYKIILFILLVLLLFSKKEFYRKRFAIKWEKSIIDVLIIIIFLTICMFRINSINKENIIFLILGFSISILFSLIILKLNMYNNLNKVKLEDCKEDIKRILNDYGGSPMAHYIYLGDKFIYLNEDKDVIIQYQIYADKVFILGSPIGNKYKILSTMKELSIIVDEYGYTPVFCSINKDLIPYLHDMGYEFMKLGEEARVNLSEFTLEGRKMKSIRNAIKRVEKNDYIFEVAKPPFSDDFIRSLKVVSDDWLGDRKEKGFSIGSFNIDYLNKTPIAIVKNPYGEIKGFANLMPMYDNSTLSIDLMRFSQESCNGIMDYIFVNLFQYAKEEGYKSFNMGLSPLSKVGEGKYCHRREKLGNYIYSYGDKLYSFKGLKNFKQKYCESWEGVYMAYKNRSSFIITVLQVMILILK